MLAEGKFPVLPLITQEIGMEEAPQIIKAMIEKKIYYCKVLIRTGL
jgi:threonine dehydrogenase-like Zn-dependent dehydrogenase